MAAFGGRVVARLVVMTRFVLAVVAFGVGHLLRAVVLRFAKGRYDARNAAQRNRHQHQDQQGLGQPAHEENRITGIRLLTAARRFGSDGGRAISPTVSMRAMFATGPPRTLAV